MSMQATTTKRARVGGEAPAEGETSECDWLELPLGPLLQIFSYLDVLELTQVVGLVCTHWREVSADATLWRIHCSRDWLLPPRFSPAAAASSPDPASSSPAPVPSSSSLAPALAPSSPPTGALATQESLSSAPCSPLVSLAPRTGCSRLGSSGTPQPRARHASTSSRFRRPASEPSLGRRHRSAIGLVDSGDASQQSRVSFLLSQVLQFATSALAAPPPVSALSFLHDALHTHASSISHDPDSPFPEQQQELADLNTHAEDVHVERESPEHEAYQQDGGEASARVRGGAQPSSTSGSASASADSLLSLGSDTDSGYEETDSEDADSDDQSESGSDFFSTEEDIDFADRMQMFHTPLLGKPFVRQFLLGMLEHLENLDGGKVTAAERTEAQTICQERFQLGPNDFAKPHGVLSVLHSRQLGVRRCRLNSKEASDEPVRALSRSHCPLQFQSRLAASVQQMDRLPTPRVLVDSEYAPRQFEYHHSDACKMIVGTSTGYVLLVNPHADTDSAADTVVTVLDEEQDNFLGLSWLRKENTSHFLAGSATGSIRLVDISKLHDSTHSPVVYTYPMFPKLTSVNCNSTDQLFLASGYSRNITLYDLATGQQLKVLRNLHTEHINVLKFAHHSPNLFATSSFDAYVKLWDLRDGAQRPVFSCQSNKGNVMVCFSHDDRFLLSSGIDNEVRQWDARSGRLHCAFNIQPRQRDHNYTRSYYMNEFDRPYIIVGSCDQDTIRIYDAINGKYFREVPILDPAETNRPVYCQSLRGDPMFPFHFSVLASRARPFSSSTVYTYNLVQSRTDSDDCLL
mmetsp:Transcript_700/g.2144  ORF Transcript_700/g.2144 Transcript_700/m.2144 type:complete len:803 (+) Transcript_700:68-2476(+)